MADINSKLEIGVTTGAIRGSNKVHVRVPGGAGINVAMREINLEPSSGEPPLRVYDTSGPYTDPAVTIDIAKGLAPLRRAWQLARGDAEEYAPRDVRPEDNGQLGRTSRGAYSSASPRASCQARRSGASPLAMSIWTAGSV